MTVEQRISYSSEGENDSAHLWSADEAMTHAVGERLELYYPGHLWAVTTSHMQGVVTIALGGFLQWGARVLIADLKSDPGMRAIVLAAGELLERLRMPRAGFHAQDYHSALRRMPSWRYRNKKPPTT